MIRIQLRRTPGWRKPAGAIVVSRPSRFGNPWDLDTVNRAGHLQPDGNPWTLDDILRWYRGWAEGGLKADPTWLDELLDADAIACWCPLVDADGNPVPCHGDILSEMVERRRAELLAAA